MTTATTTAVPIPYQPRMIHHSQGFHFSPGRISDLEGVLWAGVVDAIDVGVGHGNVSSIQRPGLSRHESGPFDQTYRRTYINSGLLKAHPSAKSKP